MNCSVCGEHWNYHLVGGNCPRPSLPHVKGEVFRQRTQRRREYMNRTLQQYTAELRKRVSNV